MRAVPILVGLSLWWVPAAATAQTAPPPAAAVAAPQAEVRAGPSDKFYVTGKLRQGEKVTVLEEVPGGWLKIKAPEGSYSWVCGRFLRFLDDKKKVAVVETLAEAPVRIGSAAPDAEPSVEQVKLTRGSQVVIIGEPYTAPDGSVWWPIAPPEQEVRYVAKDAVRLTPAVETVSGSSPPAAESLWAQAEKAEQARDVARAIQLYYQQAQQTTDHDLQQRCYSRIQFLRDGQASAPDPRFAPVPAYAGGPAPAQPVSVAPPRPPAPAPMMQASGPGYLRRAGFAIDGRPSYVLTDSMGRPLMYATGQQGLNLELFVNQAVELYGTINYRGDLRTNYAIVAQVRQLQ